MHKVRGLLTKLFLLSMAPFVLLGSGFQPTPFQCEGVKGDLQVLVASSNRELSQSLETTNIYSDDENLFLRFVLDIVPLQSRASILFIKLSDIKFDNNKYGDDVISNHMVSEDLALPVRSAVLSALGALNILKEFENPDLHCNFHQITLSEQQVVLNVRIGDQVFI